ncbi:MAG TPA: PQQ-binding-like beta-propeller repeat protein, partial [Gemmataceae bacterium]|nr:PQQ-binding-like beta-propeller repeat protein [Gemmataceae bacterium]
GWGFTWSPLVDGDHLICVPGGPKGLLAALDKKTGDVVWRSTGVTDQAPYSSPIVAEVGGVRQYVQMTYRGMVGVAAKDGKLLWTYKRTPAYNDVLIPTPIFHDDRVFATSGMGSGRGVGCDLVRITHSDGAFKATKVYANQNMESRMGQVVLVNDHVFGWSASRRVPGWVCLDFKTGKVAWNEAEKLGAGSVIAADGDLYCYGEEDGIAALVGATPEKYTEKGRFTIPEQTKQRAPGGKIWTPPVVANGHLYLRDQELIFCYDVKGRE